MAEIKNEGFLSRWSRRKVEARHGSELPEPAEPYLAAAPEAELAQPEVAAAPDPASTADTHACFPGSQAAVENESVEAPALTLADVAKLTRDSDFTPFMAKGVDTGVKNAALKKLFSDPHFNVMDGLDVYIDDYNAPSPLPQHLLLKMAQAKFLGLVQDTADEALAHLPNVLTGDAQAAPPTLVASAPPANPIAPHEDADLQLQPDDDAGRSGAASGPGEDAGHEH